MAQSLESVLEHFKNKYALDLDGTNRSFYLSFLQRQEAREKSMHTDYNLESRRSDNRRVGKPYFNVMVDKLLLFSYLTGKMEIIAGYNDNAEIKRIESINNLYLLRPAEIGRQTRQNEDFSYRMPTEKRTDLVLYHLISRIISRKQRSKTQNWPEMINELAEDEGVIDHFGQKINYQMVLKCKSPNPLTYNHGGNRRSKVFTGFKQFVTLLSV